MFIRVIINHSGIFEIIIHIFLCVLNFLNGYHLIKDGCGSVYNQQMSSNGNKNISISRAKSCFYVYHIQFLSQTSIVCAV